MMMARSIGAWCLRAIAVSALLALAAPALAHDATRAADSTAGVLSPATSEASAPASSAEPPAAGLTWLALGAVALAIRRRPRRAVVLALALVLLIFAFETALHSVHHLGGEQASHCAVASVATHLSGLGVPSISLGDPVLRADGQMLAIAPRVWPAGPLRPVTGRAPPTV
jgi:hypothetical protein